MTPNNTELKRIVHQYLSTRDNLQAKASGGNAFVPGMKGPRLIAEFDAMINAHANTIGHMLPFTTLAEWQAFAELVNAKLALVRIAEDKRNAH